MTHPDVHLSARCQDCGKSHRVPAAERTYTCKACGGEVHASTVPAAAESPAPVLEGSVECEECQAINPGGTEYCVECGTTLPPSRPHPGSDAARRIRHEAQTALKRASLGFNVVTWTYHFGALAFAVATLFAVMALARPDVPRAEGVLVVALTTTLSVLFGMGALHAHFKPFQWTIAIALATTGVTVVHLVGPNPFGLALYGSAAWALLAWLLLIPTFWFRRLIATHKDLYITHLASAQTRRSLRGHTAHERHERLLDAMRRAARRTWKVSVGAAVLVVAASAFGTVSVLKDMRVEELEPAIAAFEQAWNTDDLDAVKASFPEGVREVASTRLAGLVKGHGWDGALPRLEAGVTTEDEDGVSVDYALGAVTVATRWQRSGPAWTLAEVEVPKPPVGPVFEEFLSAWRRSDVEAVAGFFAEDVRASMRTNIEKALADRGWDALPAVNKTKLSEDETGAVAKLVLERREVTTEWHFRIQDGAWRLHVLRFPKR